MEHKRLDGYIRVSRIGGRAGDGYISPDVQRAQIEDYARTLNAEVIEWHSDEDFTGGNTDRPGFQEAIRRIESGDTDGLIVAHTDRFSRSVADGSAMVQRILAAGGLFASALERMDPSTPTGQYMLNSFLNNAELTLNMFKRSWIIAKERAVERGVHIGRTPFGYDRSKSEALTPGGDAQHVRTIFEHRLAGDNYTDIARLLDDLAPKETPWTSRAVRYMLGNRAYLGEVSYRGSKHDLGNEVAHEPIVSRELFNGVQATLTTRPYIRTNSMFLLSGLVRCAGCGYAMTGHATAGPKRETAIYRCSHHGKCPSPSVIVCKNLDAYVVDLAQGLLDDIQDLRLEPTGEQTTEDRIAEIGLEVDVHLQDLDLKRALGAGRWREHLTLLLARQSELQKQRERAVDRVGVMELAGTDLSDLDQDTLRAVLRRVVDRIEIRRGRVPIDQRATVFLVTSPGDDPVSGVAER